MNFMKYIEQNLTNGNKVLLVDDCISEISFVRNTLIELIQPYGKSQQEIIRQIKTRAKNTIPVIGSTIKYDDKAKRSSYEGIKLLFHVSEHFPNNQDFFILSFESISAMKQKEFGYIFNATNIHLISYNYLITS